jgi:hypothetical protein
MDSKQSALLARSTDMLPVDLSVDSVRAMRSGVHSTALISPHCFRLISGEGDLSDVQFGPIVSHSQSCRYCGIRTFGKSHLATLGGDLYAINLATLDELASETADLAAIES